MSSHAEQADTNLVKNAYQRWMHTAPVTVTNTDGLNLTITGQRYDLWILMAFIQMAAAHTAISPMMRHNLIMLGRELQETVCDTPELYNLAEAGWNTHPH